MKYTKEQRHEIYKEVLKKYPNQWGDFLCTLFISLGYDINDFTELWELSDKIALGYFSSFCWWYSVNHNHQSDRSIRIKMLEKVIEQTK